MASESLSWFRFAKSRRWREIPFGFGELPRRFGFSLVQAKEEIRKLRYFRRCRHQFRHRCGIVLKRGDTINHALQGHALRFIVLRLLDDGERFVEPAHLDISCGKIQVADRAGSIKPQNFLHRGEGFIRDLPTSDRWIRDSSWRSWRRQDRCRAKVRSFSPTFRDRPKRIHSNGSQYKIFRVR